MKNTGSETITFIEKHQLDLNPEVFSVIYESLSDNTPFLAERLNTLIETNQVATEAITVLYRDYIFQKQLHASIITEEEVAQTLVLIDKVHQRLEETTHTLDTVKETLEFRDQVIKDIDTSDEINLVKETLSHDINTLTYELNDSNLWIKYRQKNIKEQLQGLKDLQRVHYEDKLTGLPNKFFLRHKLAALPIHSDESSSHIFIGKVVLDNIQELNSNHGRTIGDAVIRKLGHNIQQVMPDNWETYRVAGNVFAISADSRTQMHDMSLKLIALKKTFSNKKFKSRLSENPVIMQLSVNTITLHQAMAYEEVFEQLDIE